jgi:hypothetical protein
MPKFMSNHTLQAGELTKDKINQFAQASQEDEDVKGYRSFINLSEGKAVCILEASTKEAVAGWFQKMGMPYDDITQLELEGERGSIQEV